MSAPHHSVFYRLVALLAIRPIALKHWRHNDTNTSSQARCCSWCPANSVKALKDSWWTREKKESMRQWVHDVMVWWQEECWSRRRVWLTMAWSRCLAVQSRCLSLRSSPTRGWYVLSWHSLCSFELNWTRILNMCIPVGLFTLEFPVQFISCHEQFLLNSHVQNWSSVYLSSCAVVKA